MNVLNYGSLNYDSVYQVSHMVKPGETLSADQLHVNCGGKGLNQSIAIRRAGIPVYHAGILGDDGKELSCVCEENQIHTRHIKTVPGRSGHAMIQVNPEGENSILLYEGTNGRNTIEQIEEVLSWFTKGDILLLQNEVNLLNHMINLAYERGMRIYLNPSPFNEKVRGADLEKVSVFLLNEIEGSQMTGETKPQQMIDALHVKYHNSEVVLTLGKKGCIYSDGKRQISCPGFLVKAVDTTAAGDTFTGYYIASQLSGKDIESSLRYACGAAALAVTKRGAAVSIPDLTEVERFLSNYKSL